MRDSVRDKTRFSIRYRTRHAVSTLNARQFSTKPRFNQRRVQCFSITSNNTSKHDLFSSGILGRDTPCLRMNKKKLMNTTCYFF